MTNENKNKRKSIIYLTIGVLTLIVLVAGATYAYFQSQTKNGTSFSANVTAGTTDNLTFSINDLNVGYGNITDDDGNNGIVINANQQNFGEKANSIGDGVIGKAILIANDNTKEASYDYYVYVNIINNDLEYTSYKKENDTKEFKTREEKETAKLEGYISVPELIMTIRKNNQPYTSDISGLTQTTITTKDGENIVGYDITEVKRNILIKEETIKVEKGNEKLKSEDTWEISIILKNLETNQQLNTDKEVKGEVIIQSEEIEPIQKKLLADANKPGQEETLIYHNGEIIIDEQVMDAEDYSYRYIGGDYKITSKNKDKYDSVYTSILDNNIAKKLIKHMCNNEEQYVGSYCNPEYEEYFYLDYDVEVHYSSIYEATKRALTDEYIETNVNNYVCFGGECSNDPANDNYSNLYRIIGVFPTDLSHTTYQMKIIKANATTEAETGGTGVGAYAGKYNGNWKSYYKGDQTNYFSKIASYYWNKNQNGSGDNTNDWSKSNLNIENLNKIYLNYMKEKDSGKWYNMIEEHIWITAGNTESKLEIQNAKLTFENEIKTPDVGSKLPTAAPTHKAKVGLMYVSDYMYGASKDYWTKKGWDNSATNDYRVAVNDNWLNIGLSEWIISRSSDRSNYALNLGGSGAVYNSGVSGNIIVRPCLYLNSNVKIIDGNGTPEKPYIISE